MKRLFSLSCALLAAVSLLAQGRVSTRKYILNDFTDKVTQVVLTGNEVLDSELRQSVVDAWTSSPFEFCTPERFESLKTQDRYYFLLTAESRFKGEENPGITFLTLVKGGAEASEGVGAMTEVISLPFTSAHGGSGRELVYLSTLVQTVQSFTLAAMESEKVAYGMEAWVNKNFEKNGKMKQIFLAREDLSATVQEKDLERYVDEDFHITDTSEEADQAYLDGTYNTLVGYVVAPLIPENGASYCYKLLFEAHSRELHYIQKHKITQKSGIGFTADDLKRLAKKR